MGSCCNSKPSSCGATEKPVKEDACCRTEEKSTEKAKGGCCGTKK